jgi:thioredoxin 1
MIDKPVNVTDEEFEEKVLNSDLPVIVDFWAGWCIPCKMVAPILDKIAKEQAGKLLITKLDVDKNQVWATKYNVQGIPTTIFIYKGKTLYRQVGAAPEPLLRNIVEQFLKVANKTGS